GHSSAKDPYFLYAASNVGSLLALLCYPFVIEPILPLATQSWVWAAGYVVLVGLTFACGRMMLRSHPAGVANEPAKFTRFRGAAPGGSAGRVRRGAVVAEAAMARVGDGAVEPDARRDDVPDHRRGVDPAVVADAPEPVPPHVHRRVLAGAARIPEGDELR